MIIKPSIRSLLVATACLIGALIGACAQHDVERPIVVQGAMDVEIRQLAGRLEHATEEKVGGWTFWRGSIDGHSVVVSKTLKGMENAAAATAIVVERYHPRAIINQGTAGGHQLDLHVNDIVLGTESVNIGSFKTGFRGLGQGSQFGEWVPLDLNRSDGSAGQDPNARTMRRFRGDEGLLSAARAAKDSYRKGRVVDGVIASSEVWNSELDRIQRLHEQFGTTAEEMETASAAQIAGLFEVPFLGIRVVSNNITNGDAYDSKSGENGQEFVYEVVKVYVRNKSTR
jgi:adenosylhomocysteine nucleosidase